MASDVAWATRPFFNEEREDTTLAHGDDYVSSALSEDLDWLERELGNANEIKTQRTKPEGDKGNGRTKSMNTKEGTTRLDLGSKTGEGHIVKEETDKLLRTISGITGHIAWDDVTGGELKLAGVTEARREELRFFKMRNAYRICPRSAVE